MDALAELCQWFFALDHTHYYRWVPVHLKDMTELSDKHPDVAAKFQAGHFTTNKTAHRFSAMALDQAHEQNNACIKGDGGAVGLTGNPSALRRWMVAGPEVARDVRALTLVMEEMGNPFEEESADLMVLHTKEILCPEAVKSVQNVVKLGREQFHSYLADKITDAPHVTSIILDGPAVVEMLKPGSIRCNRGKGIRRRVTPSGPLPSNWQNFLRNSDNKEELFSFLSNKLCSWLSKKVNNYKKQVLTIPPRKDTANLAPCNHEEADTRMMVHAADALECGHRRILIRTVDTDIVILAVALENERSEVLDELWLTFGTGKNRLFHALTGCDTVSAFAGHSKKAAWATRNAFPEVTTAFLSLASTTSELPDGVLSTLERFIVLFYYRTSTCCDVNVLRKKLFSRKSRSLEDLPPTRAALE
ncbi:hypothetical protein Hamer_G006188, partial [Homarus americanus]